MKSILFLLAFIFFSQPFAVSAQTEQEKNLLRSSFEKLTMCQANYKITAYYIGIYQAVRTQVEKSYKKSDDKDMNGLRAMLKRDWEEAESIMSTIQEALLRVNKPIDNAQQLYEIAQLRILEESLKFEDYNDLLNSLFKRNTSCHNSVSELKTLLAR